MTNKALRIWPPLRLQPHLLLLLLPALHSKYTGFFVSLCLLQAYSYHRAFALTPPLSQHVLPGISMFYSFTSFSICSDVIFLVNLPYSLYLKLQTLY